MTKEQLKQDIRRRRGLKEKARKKKTGNIVNQKRQELFKKKRAHLAKQLQSEKLTQALADKVAKEKGENK